MPGYHSLEVRAEAVGMVRAGMTIRQVARDRGIPYRTVQNWVSRKRSGESLETKGGKGRKKILSRKAKIVIAKSVGKRHQSTRKLAKRLSAVGEGCSKDTVQRYLQNNLGVKSRKRPKKPALSEKNIRDRYAFAKMAKNLTLEQWKNVIFTDEKPFPLFWVPNRQVDRVWAKSAADVQPIPVVKKSQGIQVWGAMSASGLSELHIWPQAFRLNAKSYQEDVLEGEVVPLLARKKTTGPITSRKLVPIMSEAIYQHDGAPAHFAVSSEEWLKKHVPSIWGKGVWPGISPDLNPIENLWSILQDRLDSRPTRPQNLTQLEKFVKEEWEKISIETLSNLIISMPSRIKAVFESKGRKIVA